MLAVHMCRLGEHLGREVRGEGVGQTELSGELSPEEGRSQDDERHVRSGAGVGADSGDPALTGEIPVELHDVAVETVCFSAVATQCAHRGAIGARGTAQPKIDAPGEERLKGAELLGDHQRSVIGQHDPARADPDALGGRRDVLDDQCRSRGRDVRHVVVLGEPQPGIAQSVCRLRQAGATGDRFRRGFSGTHDGEIQKGQGPGYGHDSLLRQTLYSHPSRGAVLHTRSAHGSIQCSVLVWVRYWMAPGTTHLRAQSFPAGLRFRSRPGPPC